MKFRKKPVIVEAEQFFNTAIEMIEKYNLIWPRVDKKYTIKTLEGDMFLSEGDWIITGIAGEKYPCKDSIFRATYERVE